MYFRFKFFLSGIFFIFVFTGCEFLADLNAWFNEEESCSVFIQLDLNGGKYKNSGENLFVEISSGESIKNFMYKRMYDELEYPDFLNPSVTGTLYNAYHIRKTVGTQVYWLEGFTRTKDSSDFVDIVSEEDQGQIFYAKWVPAESILPVYYDRTNPENPIRIVFRPEDFSMKNILIDNVILFGHFPNDSYWFNNGFRNEFGGEPDSYKYCLTKNQDDTYSINLPESFLEERNNPTIFKFMVFSGGREIRVGFNTEDEFFFTPMLPYEFFFVTANNRKNLLCYPARILEFLKGNYIESSNLSEKITVTLNGNGGICEGASVKTETVYSLVPLRSSFGFKRDGYVFKGWSFSPEGGNIPGSVDAGSTFYACWKSIDSLEKRPVFLDSEDNFVFVFDPALYFYFIGYPEQESLDIYIRSGFNGWLQNGYLWAPDERFRLKYNPETGDYRLKIPFDEMVNVYHAAPGDSFKFYLDDGLGFDETWYGYNDCKLDEVEVDLKFSFPDFGTGDFKIPEEYFQLTSLQSN